MPGLGRQVMTLHSHPRTDICVAFHDTSVSEAVSVPPRTPRPCVSEMGTERGDELLVSILSRYTFSPGLEPVFGDFSAFSPQLLNSV